MTTEQGNFGTRFKNNAQSVSRSLRRSMLGYRLKKDRAVNFLDYFQAYINSYTKKDIRMVQIALSRFKDFLKEKYPMNECSIKPELITKENDGTVCSLSAIPKRWRRC